MYDHHSPIIDTSCGLIHDGERKGRSGFLRDSGLYEIAGHEKKTYEWERRIYLKQLPWILSTNRLNGQLQFKESVSLHSWEIRRRTEVGLGCQHEIDRHRTDDETGSMSLNIESSMIEPHETIARTCSRDKSRQIHGWKGSSWMQVCGWVSISKYELNHQHLTLAVAPSKRILLCKLRHLKLNQTSSSDPLDPPCTS